MLHRCVLDRFLNDSILLQSAAFLTLAKTLSGKLAFAEVTAALDSLDDHLAYRTFLVGHTITAADAAVWGSLRGAGMYTHLALGTNLTPIPCFNMQGTYK